MSILLSRKISTHFLFWPLALAIGCAHSNVVLYKPNQNQNIAASYTPDQVQIYRTKGPYRSFQEIGLVHLRLNSLYLPNLYEQLRYEGHKAGATAIIDLRVTSETHTESKTIEQCEDKLECDAEGQCQSKHICNNENQEDSITTYLAVGTLINKETL